MSCDPEMNKKWLATLQNKQANKLHNGILLTLNQVL